MSLDVARLAGLRRYFTGVPCKQGHVAERWTNGSLCVTCHANHAADTYRRNAIAKKAYVKAWSRLNATKVQASKARYRDRNRESLKLKNQAYHKKNPHGHAALQAQRRAARRQATPSWVDREAIKSVYEHAAFMSFVTGIKMNVDHEVPLVHPKVCGLHVPWNLRVLTETENKRKANKFEV